MRILLPLVVFAFLISMAVYSEQGTMSTDTDSVSESEASLSGTKDSMDFREEEVQLQEESEEREYEDVINEKAYEEELEIKK